MPDIWLDVDTAITVPVNMLQLISDSDFKTPDETIAYNEAGMDLNWNFVSSNGVQTQTNVVPTIGGNYDWSHKGNAMYNIAIPASGGASINNNAEGYGWFTGVCTGILPWKSPIFGFRAAALNNALCDGGDELDVNVTKISDTSQTAGDIAALISALNDLGVADIRTAVGMAAANLDAQLAAIAGYLDTEIAQIISDIAALNDLSAANVQSACDSAITANASIVATLADTNQLQSLFVGGLAEITSKPADAAGVIYKLAYAFHMLCNKSTYNKSTFAHNTTKADGTGSIAARTVTDDGTIVTTSAIV